LKVAEEAGEVIKAAVHYAEGRETWEKVEDEAVQAIAMRAKAFAKNATCPLQPLRLCPI